MLQKITSPKFAILFFFEARRRECFSVLPKTRLFFPQSRHQRPQNNFFGAVESPKHTPSPRHKTICASWCQSLLSSMFQAALCDRLWATLKKKRLEKNVLVSPHTFDKILGTSINPLGKLHFPFQNLFINSERRLIKERWVPNQHFVSQDPKSPPIHGFSVSLRLNDFWSKVFGCPTQCERSLWDLK